MNQQVKNSHEFQGKQAFSKFSIIFRQVFWFSILLFALYSSHVSAITQCGNNGGAGWTVVSTPVAASSVLNFGDAVGPILSATLSIDISHTWIGDLDASLDSPNGNMVELFNRPGVPNSFYGCSRNDLLVVFDDAAVVGTNVENVCQNSTPTISGTYQPQNIATNPLSDLDGGTANGTWTVTSEDFYAAADPGTINEFCVTLSAASIVFDKWVSTNSSCTDTLDALTVTSGTDVYYCYTVSNVGTEQFIINPGDAVDDQGVDISGLEGTYAAGASVTVNSAAITAGGSQLPFGSTTNIATVTATGDTVDFPATQTLVTTETATLTVALAPPASGNKLLYLDSTTISRVIPAAGLADISINGLGASFSWVQSPALQTALIIDGSSGSIPLTLVLDETGAGNRRSFVLNLVSSDVSIGSFASLALSNITLPLTTTFSLDLGGTSNISLPIGSTISVRVTNTTNRTGRRILVSPNNSFVNLPALTVINVDSHTYYDAAYNGGSSVTSIAPGNTMYIRATVSDPFGSFDITSALLTITDPSSTDVVTSASMTEVFDSGAATKIYEYVYILPNNAGSLGVWSTTVVTNEGTEGTVTHSASSTFTGVLPPSLTIVKSSDVTSSAPGGVITYTIQISNSGGGIATNVLVTDDVSEFVQFDLGVGIPFTFIDGGSSSGLILGTAVYSDDNASTWIYTPVSGGGGAPVGYDGNVTDWRIPMNGSMNAGGSFSVQYQMRVE